MENPIIQFISQYIELTPQEVDIINEQNQIKIYKKDTLLLAEGAYAKECFFVIKGCIRSYYLVDGEEKTTEFYTENDGITPVSYLTNQPSEYYLSCLEDSVIALSSTERNQKLIAAVPKLEKLIIEMSSETMVQNKVSFDNFKKLNPEQHYLKLLETRPDLLNRAPLQHIATYLGITPVSLSRMRKRILKKH